MTTQPKQRLCPICSHTLSVSYVTLIGKGSTRKAIMLTCVTCNTQIVKG